ncbi:hypothetical protein BaRGS_00033100 [Batillaria attramentaria]|uniref:Ion transport domain-containing protein n=1 Tax=Batillaria attramentaria TaxID=370345 RepID=A0ABD0JLG3_9CAEN
MYDHVLKKEVQLFWIYSNVAATGYPLEHIDTISPDKGHTNSKSALNLIVYGEEEGHVTMMDSLIVKLLEDKFYRRFFLFFVYCAMFVTAMVLRPGVDLCAVQQDTSSLRGCSQTGPTHNRTTDHCYLMRFYRDEDIARLTFEVCVLAGALMYVFLAVVEILYQGLSKFFTKLRNAPSMALLLLGCVLVFVMFIARLTCEHDKVIHEFEDVVGVLAILCTVPYFLFFCRGIRQVAFFIPFRKTDNSVFNNWLDSIMGMFSMSVGQHDLSESFEDLSPPFLQISKLLFVVYMVMVTLLLINMLIAMMGNTYTIVNTTENVWFRQWARIVLMIEESISPGSRLGMRRQYSQPGQNAQYASKNAKRPGDYHADKASKNAQRTSTAGHDADNADDDEKRIYVVRRHLETTREKEELMRLRIENRRPQLTTCV